jgi:uncharacterized membrane protein YGL010W
MRTINQWLDEYGVSHQNPSNKAIHFVCVPIIFFTIIGLLYCIKLPVIFGFQFTVAHVALIAVIIYYFTLSALLASGITVYILICMMLCKFIEQSTDRLLIISLVLFVLAWIAQFWGHHLEGKRPSFLKDIQFLLIGPAWIMSFLFKKIGLSV